MYGHNAEVLIRFNPGDLGEIFVQSPATKAYARIPCVNQEYAKGLSLYQHQLVRKLARTHRIRNPSIPQLLLYREELRLLTEQLRYSKKFKDHKRAVRTGEIPGKAPTAESTGKTEIIMVPELESEVASIDEVEMEEGDEGWEIPEFI
jgi:putative transposase